MDDNKSNISEDNNNELKSSFPLFNLSALKKSQRDDTMTQFNYIPFQKIPQSDEEEMLQKKFKTDNSGYKPTNNIDNKTIAKREKKWDDPDVTIREIVENRLSGLPMDSEIQMKKERTKRIKDKKNQEKSEDKLFDDLKNSQNIPANSQIRNVQESNTNNTPRVIFKDGKVVIEDQFLEPEKYKKLEIVQEKKKPKLSSMSFRTRHHTAKWTPEETRKFYKAIEIFGADFSLIAKLFPTRTREQIKKKFLKEERVNQQKMNQAFQKNTRLGKRSLISRIRGIGENPSSSQNLNFDTTNLDLSIEDLKNSQRKYSNTSVDSMDIKVVEELQNMFHKDIQPSNSFFLDTKSTNFTDTPSLSIEEKSKSDDTGNDRSEIAKGKNSQDEKPNLFYKMIR